MELRHLRYFVALAEDLNFTRAARRLNMAQPPLSQQIQQLERELGVQLFRRTNRHVELTCPGHVFLAEARSVLEQVDHAARSARRAEGRDLGKLTVGAGVTSIGSVLSQVLPAFCQDHPGVDFRLRELPPQKGADMLRTGAIDLGFLVPPFNQEDLATEVVLRDPVVAILRIDHPLANGHPIELSEIASERLVVPDRGWSPTLHDQLIRVCQEAGFSPNIVHTAGQFQTIFMLVRAGLGMGLATSSAQASSVPGVSCVPVRSATVPVQMAWRSSDESPVLRGFIQLVRSRFVAMNSE